jgi:hypothetical protein
MKQCGLRTKIVAHPCSRSRCFPESAMFDEKFSIRKIRFTSVGVSERRESNPLSHCRGDVSQKSRY